MEIYTIGFTKRSAKSFFETIRAKAIKKLIDVRLNNVSQLAGFSKKDDLQYFLQELCQATYAHEPLLAPTPELLKAYQDKRINWQEYENSFNLLLQQRVVEQRLVPDFFSGPAVLLCSEFKPDRCHRRLVLEYLQAKWGSVSPIHL